MKNLNWILHGLSLAGVLFLFIQNQNLKKAPAETPSRDTQTTNQQIAFFNSDSLLPQLNFFKQSEKDFKQKQEQMMGELQAKEANLQKEFQKMQKNAENMTRNEMESAQKRLSGMERELMERKEKLSGQFAMETAEFNEALHNKVISFLKEYNADGKYQYIFSVARDGNIFYWNPEMDITNEMVKGLNEIYK